MPLAAHTKCTAWNHGYLLLHEQALGKFMFGHAGLCDAGESIERTFGLEAIQPDLIQTLHNQAAALIIGFHHLPHIVIHDRIG